jgi:cobalt-zinc-cadmium efflux system membrane fusion protein
VRLRSLVKPLLTLAVVAGLSAAAYFTRDTWLPWLRHGHAEDPGAPESPAEPAAPAPPLKVIVSDQAQQNLGMTAKQLQAVSTWKTITVPGNVVDRPGVSDRGVVAPVTAVVTAIKRFRGDTVRPGDVLFTLRVTSESLQLTQTELFKATQDIALAQEKVERLNKLESIGTEAKLAVQEAQSQVKRLNVATKAYRQELLIRGLSPAQIDSIAAGKFVSELSVSVPRGEGADDSASEPPLEVQELKVRPGQQVQAGQTLCVLSNHRLLSIEGRAFGDESRLLARSLSEGWPVEVDFPEDVPGDWPAAERAFKIDSLANTIDPATRTFTFLLPLENQSKVASRGGRTRLLWRYRPGQKVRIRVRVEEVKNVFVLPPDAVGREGPEAFVFTQNVNTFERKGVHVLFQERDRVVIANDGSLPTYARGDQRWTIPAIALTAATQLNRIARAGTVGVPRGYHVHADGSLHKNEDEGK